MRKLIGIALLAGLIGCGGDDDDTTPAGDGGTADRAGGGDGGGGACTGPMASSCMVSFFSCFDPSGACRVQAGMTSVVCWENGARSESTINPADMSGTTTLRGSNGQVCATGTTRIDPGSGRSATDYQRGGQTLRITADATGTITVDCPNGSTETYTAAQQQQSGNCGPSGGGQCTQGACP